MSENLSYSVICLSHLRWDFVYQRPQHLLSRFAKQTKVYFVEEPIISDEPTRLTIGQRDDNLFVVVPRISQFDLQHATAAQLQRQMLEDFIGAEKLQDYLLWFYTPMAMEFASHLRPVATVFDCMDQLSAFKFAPPELIQNERRLLAKADVVFTGGQSLYEAKKDSHPNVHAFSSSIDADHFRRAREIKVVPDDEHQIPHPRVGFCGVIDERMDIGLLDKMSRLRPDWQFVMIGPVVKIAPEDLPQRANIHYLGAKSYDELPAYLSGWDIALMPFAINEATEYISPTKTPEYLAAGLPVVSTPIRDVVRPYGELGLVRIASTAEEFVAACEMALKDAPGERLRDADEFLAQQSWDKTFAEMTRIIDGAVRATPKAAAQVV